MSTFIGIDEAGFNIEFDNYHDFCNPLKHRGTFRVWPACNVLEWMENTFTPSYVRFLIDAIPFTEEERTLLEDFFFEGEDSAPSWLFPFCTPYASHNKVVVTFPYSVHPMAAGLDVAWDMAHYYQGDSRNFTNILRLFSVLKAYSRPLYSVQQWKLSQHVCMLPFTGIWSRRGHVEVDGSPMELYTFLDEYPSLPPRYTLTVGSSNTEGFTWSFQTPATGPYKKGRIRKLFNYTADVLKYLPYVIRQDHPSEQTAPLYGVELETVSNLSPESIIDAQEQLFFIIKQDASIRGRGRHAGEIVTVPCTLKSHKLLWADFFNRVNYEEFDCTTDTGNGMHVHVSQDAFSDRAHLRNFAWFFANPCNMRFTLALSERPTEADLRNWAMIPDWSAQTTKAQAHLRNEMACKNNGHKSAVNFKGSSTVEIRIFKGIVSYATIIKNLEAVDAVFHWSKTVSFQSSTLGNFLDWLSKTPKNKYSLLKKFIAVLPMEEILFDVTLKEVTFVATEPEVILERVNKSNLILTNKHLRLLNGKREKKKFILVNGKLEILDGRKKGRLSHVDKAAAAKYNIALKALDKSIKQVSFTPRRSSLELDIAVGMENAA